MDRSKIMQAVAKCLAYKACGKDIEADQWFIRLCHLLGYGDGRMADIQVGHDIRQDNHLL